jgi:hypothetical protein
MISRRTLEGALKWALRDLRLDDETAMETRSLDQNIIKSKFWKILTGADLGHCD